MRTLFTAILLAATGVAVAAPADRGPGIAARADGAGYGFAATGFDRIALGAGAAVAVRTGADFAVRAAGPAEALARLRVTSTDGALRIERRYRDQDRSEAERRADLALERQVRFAITLPRLRGVALGGSGRIAVDGVTGDAFAADLGGSGTIALDGLAVERLAVAIGGSGAVTAAGHTRALDVSLGGSGRLVAGGLRADAAKVSSAGSGSVRAEVTGVAEVSTVGSGTIDLGAGARCRVTRMGSARVRCGG